jgi:putative hydrolase of the HAD superfamily
MENAGITTLFVDIGGVLLTNGWDRTSRKRAAEKFEIDFEEMDERHHLTFDTYEEGKLSLEEYLSRAVFYKERPFSRDSFIMFMFAQSHPYPDMIEFVRRLKVHHRLKIVSVSNEGRELTEYRIKRFELNTLIDCFVTSSFVRTRKPDYDIYRIAMDIVQVPCGEAIYIEDRGLYVEAAQCLGIRGIIHKDYMSTREAIAALGLSLPEHEGSTE